MKKIFPLARHSIIIAATVLTAAGQMGCATKSPPSPEPLSGHSLQVFMGESKHPDIFGIELIEAQDSLLAKYVYNIKNSRKALLKFKSPKSSPLPVIAVKPRSGGRHDMLIDTSSRKSWIAYDIAEDFAIVPLGPNPHRYMATHVRDTVAGILCTAPYMRFDKMLISEALLYARVDHASLWPVSRSYRKPDVELVMGCGMMKTFAFLRLDFKERRVALVGDDIYPVDDERLLGSADIVWENGAIAVEAIVDGEKTLLYIDTGGDYEMARPAGDQSPCRHIFIDELAIARPEVADSQELNIALRKHPSIGARLLSRYVLVIDMARQKVYFERP